MLDDLTSRIPLRKQFGQIRSLVSHMYRLDKSYFYLNTLRFALDALLPALSLVLTADILELLYHRADFLAVMRPVCLLLALNALITLASSLLWSVCLHPKLMNLIRTYDGDLAAKYQQMDYSLVDSPYVKDLTERISKDNNWGGGIYDLFRHLDSLLHGFFCLVCALVVALPLLQTILASGNPWMYLGFAATAILLFLLSAAQAKADAVFQQKLLSNYRYWYPDEIYRKYVTFSWHWILRCLAGDYHFIKDIHLYDGYGLMKQYVADNERASDKMMPWAPILARLSGRTGLLAGVNDGLLTLLGYLVSAGFALAGAFSIGNVVRFAGSLTSILGGFQGLYGSYRELALTSRKAASTLAMLDISDEMYKGKLPLEKRLDNRYEVEFRNVSFRYPGQAEYAIRNLSLKLRIGEKMAIVGMNGSGKTTMIKLLCRLYDPEEGQILLNGVDIRKFRQDEYIRLFSVVFQDFKLLSMPLGQNVAASTEVDRERAMECLKQAGLEKRIQEGIGLDTILYQDTADDGVEISGGEAQKIAIARALYKDAPFLLLDEPTASLDPLSEYEIYSGFESMTGGKTAIYISHRLSSCRFCNDIVVFHEGRLVQRGSHEELLGDEAGKYHELWHAQAQYYT